MNTETLRLINVLRSPDGWNVRVTYSTDTPYFVVIKWIFSPDGQAPVYSIKFWTHTNVTKVQSYWATNIEITENDIVSTLDARSRMAINDLMSALLPNHQEGVSV